MAVLASPDLDRLAKLLGMLGSEHEGERASAALMADKLVRERGLTWPQVLQPLAQSAGALGSGLPHRRDAFECLAVDGIWSEQEADFLLNISRKRREPSPAQAKWLADLLDRARLRKAA